MYVKHLQSTANSSCSAGSFTTARRPSSTTSFSFIRSSGRSGHRSIPCLQLKVINKLHFAQKFRIKQQTSVSSRGRFHSRRSNTTRGQIDFGSHEHFKMTAKWPDILVVISQSCFISKWHHTFSRKMHLTSKMTEPKNRFHSRWKFLGEMNLPDKMNLTDDYETSLGWLKRHGLLNLPWD